MPVRALGFQIVSNRSAQNTKQYTALVLESGFIVKNYGGRSLSSTGVLVESGGRTDVTAVGVNLLVNELENIYNTKQKGFEYDKMTILFRTVILDVDPTDDLNAIKARGYELVKSFRDKAPKEPNGGVAPSGIYSYAVSYDPKVIVGKGVKSPAKTADSKSIIDAAKAKFHTKVEAKILRPNKEEYHPREIMGHTDVALLREFRKNNIYVRLAGPPGGGKTALAEGAFKDLITVNGHGDMTVNHFVGQFLPGQGANAGGWVWQDGPLVRAMKEGLALFVDEGTRIPTEVLNILFSVMDGRGVLRIDDRPDLPIVKAAPGFYVIMGYNPETLGARALDEALISRFRVQIEVKTDFNTATKLKVPTIAIRIARNLETRNKKDIESGGPGIWVPQMRDLLTFRDLIDMHAGEDFALATLVAACPRQSDLENLRQAVQDVAKKSINIPTLGGLV
jgi:nitric oxide reductase NorQ protein